MHLNVLVKFIDGKDLEQIFHYKSTSLIKRYLPLKATFIKTKVGQWSLFYFFKQAQIVTVH
jgi:hypothetical protein